MTVFTLDESKRFHDNAIAFLESAKKIDPDMAKILEDNWEKLLSVVRTGERDTKARTTFNESIAAALDEILSQEAEDE